MFYSKLSFRVCLLGQTPPVPQFFFESSAPFFGEDPYLIHSRVTPRTEVLSISISFPLPVLQGLLLPCLDPQVFRPAARGSAFSLASAAIFSPSLRPPALLTRVRFLLFFFVEW